MQWWNNRRGRSDDSPLATGVSTREERLSMYLDDELLREDAEDLEAELERDSDLRSSLEGMAFVRDALRELGSERAPRSFTLVAAQAPRAMRRRGYRGGVPRFEVMTRVATAVAAVALTFAVGAPVLTTMVTGGGEDESVASGAASDVALTAETAETPGAELMMSAPEESPVPDGQPPTADGSGNTAGAGGAESGGASGPGPERFADPNATANEASLKLPDEAGESDAAASDDGLGLLQITQYALAGLTVVLLIASGAIYYMRTRAIGFFR